MPEDSMATVVTSCWCKKATMARRPWVWAGNSWTNLGSSSAVKPTQTQWEEPPISTPAAERFFSGMAWSFSASFLRKDSALAAALALRLRWAPAAFLALSALGRGGLALSWVAVVKGRWREEERTT